MKSKISICLMAVFFSFFIACQSKENQKTENKSERQEVQADNMVNQLDTLNLPLDKIQMPEGFKIEVFASNIPEARSLCLSPNGTLFVGNRGGGKVYAIRDTDADFKADEVYLIAEGLNMPCGVAFKNGNLFVAEVNRILRFDDIENNLGIPPKPKIIYDKYPTDKHHGWKFIAFGPDGKLYVPVGAPCNICKEENPVYASITRMNLDGSDMEVFAHGVRNSVGFSWHPDTKELWFTDNGRDCLGDDSPPCELNYAPKKGMHFGYPYCYGGIIIDPKFDSKPCEDFTKPAQNLGPHVAPLGMRFYTGNMFPEEYRKQIFIAEHGSWNREKKIGYRITLVRLKGNESQGYETFAEGWLDEQKQEAWGRPVDVLVMPDGSMLVSDDYANVIYRISYKI